MTQYISMHFGIRFFQYINYDFTSRIKVFIFNLLDALFNIAAHKPFSFKPNHEPPSKYLFQQKYYYSNDTWRFESSG